MVWRWRYSEVGSGLDSLWCFCPNDETQLVYVEDYDRVWFECETCRKRFGPLSGDKDHVLSMVKRQIDRKIRTGEWTAELRRKLGASSQ
jgi:hypothetical protein